MDAQTAAELAAELAANTALLRQLSADQDALFAALGISRQSAAVSGRTARLWASLSRRERQVAELAGSGLTDPQIALRLVLGVRTVETHMGNIRRKLDLSSRVELAAWMGAAGLLDGGRP